MFKSECTKGRPTLNCVDSRDSFREPRGNQAIVLSSEISKMPEVLRAIEQVPGTRIIYHRTSLGRLYIVPEEDLDQRYEGGNSRRVP